jgi:hypothetical protein
LVRARSAHRGLVGEESHAAGALDGLGHVTLVQGAVPGDATGDDLAALGHEVLERRLILEVHDQVAVRAEAADLLAAEAAAAAALVVVTGATTVAVTVCATVGSSTLEGGRVAVARVIFSLTVMFDLNRQR